MLLSSYTLFGVACRYNIFITNVQRTNSWTMKPWQGESLSAGQHHQKLSMSESHGLHWWDHFYTWLGCNVRGWIPRPAFVAPFTVIIPQDKNKVDLPTFQDKDVPSVLMALDRPTVPFSSVWDVPHALGSRIFRSLLAWRKSILLMAQVLTCPILNLSSEKCTQFHSSGHFSSFFFFFCIFLGCFNGFPSFFCTFLYCFFNYCIIIIIIVIFILIFLKSLCHKSQISSMAAEARFVLQDLLLFGLSVLGVSSGTRNQPAPRMNSPWPAS